MADLPSENPYRSPATDSTGSTSQAVTSRGLRFVGWAFFAIGFGVALILLCGMPVYDLFPDARKNNATIPLGIYYLDASRAIIASPSQVGGNPLPTLISYFIMHLSFAIGAGLISRAIGTFLERLGLLAGLSRHFAERRQSASAS